MIRSLLVWMAALLLTSPAWSDIAWDVADNPENMFVNARFQDAPDPRSYPGYIYQYGGWSVPLPPGSTDIKGWIVDKGSIKLWRLESNLRLFPELHGGGGLYQKVKTRPGATYQISVGWNVGRDDHSTQKKIIKVVAGSTTRQFARDPGVFNEDIVFTASGDETPIELSNPGEGFGPTLAAVYMRPWDPVVEAARGDIERLYAKLIPGLKQRNVRALASMFAPSFEYRKKSGEVLTFDQYAAALEADKIDPAVRQTKKLGRWAAPDRDHCLYDVLEEDVTTRPDDTGRTHTYRSHAEREDTWVRTADGWKLQYSVERSRTIYVDGKLQSEP